MTSRLRCRMFLAVTICAAAIATTACSTRPRIDGGIVGTGNRVDCDAQSTKDRAPGSAPEDCRTGSSTEGRHTR
jgi:hypothetical protein